MKGDVAVNTIGIIAIIAVTVFLFFTILPQVIDFLITEVSLNSPSAVSRELARYITISGAAPDYIQISYYPSSLHYDVELKDRIASVKISEGEQGNLEKTPYAYSFAIDPVNSFQGVNTFFISKSNNIFQVDAEWIEKG